MKLLDFVARESIVVDLRATGKEQAIREMVGSLHGSGRLAEGRRRERHPRDTGPRRTRLDWHRDGRGGPTHSTSNAQSPGWYSRPLAQGRRICRLGRRDGRYFFSAGLAPEPARRPPSGPREYLAALERRAFRRLIARGTLAGKDHRSPGESRPGYTLKRTSRPPEA